MVKTLITIIVTFGIFLGGAVYEQRYIAKSFDELRTQSVEVYEKLNNKTATAEDVVSLRKFWHVNKKRLHVFIPHSEIKELDLWISECVRYTQDGNYGEAVSKIQVVLELIDEIPKNFLISPGNIF